MKAIKIISMLTLLAASFVVDAKLYSYDASDKKLQTGSVDTDPGWEEAMRTYVNLLVSKWELGDVVRIEGENGVVAFRILASWPFTWKKASWTQIEAARLKGFVVLRQLGSGGATNDCLIPVPDCELQNEPLMIDLGQDGFHLGQSGVGIYYDFFGDNVFRPVQWVAKGANDAFLAIDKNGNGIIDNGSELFGRGSLLSTGQQSNHGFEELGQYDALELGGNGDGVITKADAVWSKLSLWLDENADGVSNASELLSLEQHKITELEIDSKENGRRDPAGNLLRFWAWAHNEKPNSNNKLKMVDVFFKSLGTPIVIEP